MKVYQRDDGVLVIDGQHDVIPIHQALVRGEGINQIQAIITNFIFDEDQRIDIDTLDSSSVQIKNCETTKTETLFDKQIKGMYVQEVQKVKPKKGYNG